MPKPVACITKPHGPEALQMYGLGRTWAANGTMLLLRTQAVRPHMGINMLTPKEAIALYHKS